MIPFVETIYGAKGLYQELLSPICKKYDLTDNEIMILLYIADEKTADTAKELISSLKIKKSVVSMSIKDLEERELVHSSYSETNRKIQHLEVDEKACEIISEAKKIQEEYYDIITKGLGKTEKKIFNKLLDKVGMNIRSQSK